MRHETGDSLKIVEDAGQKASGRRKNAKAKDCRQKNEDRRMKAEDRV